MNPAKKQLKLLLRQNGIHYYLFNDGLATKHQGPVPVLSFRFDADGYIIVTHVARSQKLMIRTGSINVLLEKMVLHKFLAPATLLTLLKSDEQRT